MAGYYEDKKFLTVTETDMKKLTGFTLDKIIGHHTGYDVGIYEGCIKICPKFSEGIYKTVFECEYPELAKAVRKI